MVRRSSSTASWTSGVILRDTWTRTRALLMKTKHALITTKHALITTKHALITTKHALIIPQGILYQTCANYLRESKLMMSSLTDVLPRKRFIEIQEVSKLPIVRSTPCHVAHK